MSLLTRLGDSLRNVVSGLGTAKDKSTHNAFVFQPMTRGDIDATYLEDGLARKIVDKMPADEVREWRTWEARQAETIYAAERALGIKAKVQQARTWARLYGGAAILIGDGSTDPSKPLDLEGIGKGGCKYLHVLSRHELAAGDLERDILSPNFGRPRTYTLANTTADAVADIHYSRLVIFDGIDCPRIIREANQGWGLPLFQAIRTAIMNVAAGTANAAAMTEEAKLDIIKVPDLTAQLSDAEGQRRLITRFSMASQMKSTINTLLLSDNETFERKQMQFAGLTDLLRLHIEVAAAVSDYPVTELIGTSAKGLAATGEGDARSYYDTIKARQTGGLTTELTLLDDALLRHALGRRPRNVAYSWVPLWQPSPTEKAAVAKTRAETTQIYAGLGLFPAAGFALSVRDQIIDDSVYPSFDQHVEAETLEKLGDEPLKVEKAPPAAPKPPGEPKPKAPAALADAAPRSLYVSRPVLNAKAILAWAARAGIPNLVPADELHVTVMHSSKAVDWFAAYEAPETLRIASGGARDLDRFGDAGEAVVLLFRSDDLCWRHRDLHDLGAEHSWPDFNPHITLSKDAAGFDVSAIDPYTGPIVLGPERFREVNPRPALAA